MKRQFMVAITLIASLFCKAQELTFSDLTTELEHKRYEKYTAKDGTVFQVGGKLKMGLPSNPRQFVYVEIVDPLAGNSPVLPTNANREVEIKRIEVSGKLKKGYKVWVVTNGGVALERFYFDIENALQTREVKGDGMSSDEALAQLKRAKEKLDLGLITQQEFDKLKSELSKFIQ